MGNKKVVAKIKRQRTVMFHKELNVGTKKYIAISRKGEKIVAAANTRKALATKLLKRRGDFFIIENPKVREANIMKIAPRHLPKAKKRYLIY